MGNLELASFPGDEPAGLLGQTQWTGVLLDTLMHTMGETGTAAGWKGDRKHYHYGFLNVALSTEHRHGQ